MSSEWQAAKLGDCVAFSSGNTPSKSEPRFWNGLIPWISAKDMKSFWVEDSQDHLTDAGIEVASAVVPTGTTLLLTRGMTLHNDIPIVRTRQSATFNQDVKALSPKPGALAEFIPYLLLGNKARIQSLVDSAGHGTGRLGSEQLKALCVLRPPIAEQRELSMLFGTLDDRIALLRETNATLEAIAQALFKSWFVDFDPVHAKQQRLAPAGIDDATAALFPDSFEESALGLLPKGWRASALSDAFEINPQRSLKKGVVAPYLDMASVATSGHCVEPPVQREFGSGTKFRNGDSLLARITPCLENGKSAFIDFLAEDQVGWGSTEFIVLRPKAPLPEYLGYLLCRHPPFRKYAIHSMSGTSGRQRVQNDVLGRYLLAVPGAAVATAFAEIVASLHKAIATNHSQAQTLATLRDTLLPRLISGRLRLPEAEREVMA